MERYRRGRGKKALLGSHQKCWLWGRHLVIETLRAGRWPILDLYLSDRLPAALAGEAREAAERVGVPICVESPDALSRRCHTEEHQGFLARMSEFPYARMEDILAERPASPLYALTAGIQDPHNLGAILRSAEVFGLDALFIEERGQVGVTSMVARSSAGAVNRIPVARARLLALADRMRAEGIAVVGASEKAATGISDFDFARPCAIVIGNEGSGISAELAARCSAMVRIPQAGAIGSLNAAAAAAVFFYEARRQRACRASRSAIAASPAAPAASE